MDITHETAGGVVVNDAGLILTLERHVQRDGVLRHELRLPKGHIDSGETPEQAALREVCEESGYCDCEIVASLGEAITEYSHLGKDYCRRERYYLMRLRADVCAASSPCSAEEALFAPRWLSPMGAIQDLTYPSEQEFARRASGLIST